MPRAAPKACRHPGCKRPATAGAYCDDHRRIVERQYDACRESSSKRGYNSRWQKARDTFLRRSPLCRMCHEEGRITPALIVDHIIPHRGDQELFWDTGNWQSLCKWHHDSVKQAEEKAEGRGGKKSPPKTP